MMKVNLYKVQSSNIKCVGYDNVSSKLLISFGLDSVYEYKNVPVELAEQFFMSESYGKFFHSRIRNAYETVKLPLTEDKFSLIEMGDYVKEDIVKNLRVFECESCKENISVKKDSLTAMPVKALERGENNAGN